MWDFHAKFMREAWQVRRRSEITERDAHCQAPRAVLLAGLEERRRRQGGPECPKQIEEMNTYAKAKLKLF